MPPNPSTERQGSRSSTSSDALSGTDAQTPRPVQPQRPMLPSNLRNSLAPQDLIEHSHSLQASGVERIGDDGIHPEDETASAHSENITVSGTIDEPQVAPTVRSRLLGRMRIYARQGRDEDEDSRGRRPRYLPGYGSFASTSTVPQSPDEFGGPQRDGTGGKGDRRHAMLGDAVTDGLLGHANGDRLGTTTWLARRHGISETRLMYLMYYIPSINWIRQYRWQFLQGDLIAALTMASFYIPMSLSYASNLGHIPPINGLYSFVFNPFIYALLGTCPQMVVGPEAAGSLLTGSVVREAIQHGHFDDQDGRKSAQVAGMVTGLAGSFILGAGLARLGFLDSVLSRPFLRGFISAIGIVILIDQLIPEMGLDTVAAHSSAGSHGSSLDKIMFLIRHIGEASAITCAVGFGSFAVTMVCREIKRHLQPRMDWVAYVPDRFLIVVLSAVFTWKFSWDKQGLDVLGDIKAKGAPFQAHFPFAPENFKHIEDALSTALLVALLGFFESSVAAKSLGAGAGHTKKFKTADGHEEPLCIKNVQMSANRELVALGIANLVGGTFMSLPAFGGYGRSKVNASTGGKTPMSSVFLSLISIICVLFLLPYFYYIPKAVLSAMISVVAWSLIEEAPSDLLFFWRISGYSELLLMFVIFLTTFFWNLRVGIAVGIGLSLLRLLKHSTRPRIQILGRDPDTMEFENAEAQAGPLEFIPYCLIVKIPEPLTFANTGSLKERLRKLEDYGTSEAHPALPKVRRAEHNRNIIFDVHGVTALDPAAMQVLLEIVRAYIERGTRVIFCRVPSRKSEVWRLFNVSGLVDLCGGERHFCRSVDEALQLAEREMSVEQPAEGSSGGTNTPAPATEHDALAGSSDTSADEERRIGTA